MTPAIGWWKRSPNDRCCKEADHITPEIHWLIENQTIAASGGGGHVTPAMG